MTGTAADAQFMRNMIAHHAQALAMVDLIAARTARADMKLLGERIRVSQQDEIGMMQRWLRSRGHQAAADTTSAAHAHTAVGGTMPGMLTPTELERLAMSRGTEFDRAFLSLMIRHHEGALVMVQRLFATPGAGQDTDIYFFASDVESDQRAEIERMRGMLAGYSPIPPHRR